MSSSKLLKDTAPLLSLLDKDLSKLSNEELLDEVEKLQEISRNTMATKAAISTKGKKPATKAKAVEMQSKTKQLLSELGL